MIIDSVIRSLEPCETRSVSTAMMAAAASGVIATLVQHHRTAKRKAYAAGFVAGLCARASSGRDDCGRRHLRAVN